jgi:hypothetical protein
MFLAVTDFAGLLNITHADTDMENERNLII